MQTTRAVARCVPQHRSASTQMRVERSSTTGRRVKSPEPPGPPSQNQSGSFGGWILGGADAGYSDLPVPRRKTEQAPGEPETHSAKATMTFPRHWAGRAWVAMASLRWVLEIQQPCLEFAEPRYRRPVQPALGTNLATADSGLRAGSSRNPCHLTGHIELELP